MDELILNAGGLKKIRPASFLEPATIIGETSGRDQFDVRNLGVHDLHDSCPNDDDQRPERDSKMGGPAIEGRSGGISNERRLRRGYLLGAGNDSQVDRYCEMQAGQGDRDWMRLSKSLAIVLRCFVLMMLTWVPLTLTTDVWGAIARQALANCGRFRIG